MNVGDKKAFSSTNGELIFNGKPVMSLSSIEAKVQMEYFDIELANTTKKYRKYKGYEVSGTIKVNKVSSEFPKLISDTIKKGYAPKIDMQTILTDPAFIGAEVVAYYDVTIDEMLLAKIKPGEVIEYEIPFKASSYEFLDVLE